MCVLAAATMTVAYMTVMYVMSLDARPTAHDSEIHYIELLYINIINSTAGSYRVLTANY